MNVIGIDTLFAHRSANPEQVKTLEKIQGIYTKYGSELAEILGVTDVTKLSPNSEAYWALQWLRQSATCCNQAVLMGNDVGTGAFHRAAGNQ